MRHLIGASLVVVTLLMISTASAQTANDKIGQVSFPISCNPAVQKPFERGGRAPALVLVPRVGRRRSPPVTQAIRTARSGYWGIAHEPLVPDLVAAEPRRTSSAGGRRSRRRRPRTTKTPARARFRRGGRGVLQGRATSSTTARARVAYEQAMEQVVRSLSAGPRGRRSSTRSRSRPRPSRTTRPTRKQKKSAELAEKVFAAEPDHPGAAHYIIHGYDYPALAQRGLDRRAAATTQFAPAVPHALHMPSHIYVLLGMWPETIQGNIVAAGGREAPRQSRRPHARARLPRLRATCSKAQDATPRRVLDRGARAIMADLAARKVRLRPSDRALRDRGDRGALGDGARPVARGRRASSRARTASPTPRR